MRHSFSPNNVIGLIIVSTLLSALLLGCPDERKKFADTANPEWAYDQPFYYRPADGPAPLKNFNDPAPDIYTNKRLIQIPRPTIGDFRKAPRIAIWITEDNGVDWEKIGYFGLQQKYFPYEVDEDGVYGIRFIGPGIPPAECKPPKPHMNFYVDTSPPEVSVFVSPDQEFYTPGQMITIDWNVMDENIKPKSAKISVCLNSSSADLRWDALGKVHNCIDRTQLVIPDEAIDKTMTIRITAEDKAGNLGYGYSCPIVVMYEPAATQPTTQPATKPGAPKVIISSEGPQVLTTMPAEDFSDLLKENNKKQK